MALLAVETNAESVSSGTDADGELNVKVHVVVVALDAGSSAIVA